MKADTTVRSMLNEIPVRCDKCMNVFNVNKLQTRPFLYSESDDSEKEVCIELFFTCANVICGQEFISGVYTPKLILMQTELKDTNTTEERRMELTEIINDYYRAILKSRRAETGGITYDKNINTAD